MKFQTPSLIPLLLLPLTACPQSAEGLLRVSGLLDGVGDNASFAAEHVDAQASGVWWPCDAMLTSVGCTSDRYARIFLALPTVTDIINVGGRDCVDQAGTPDDLTDDVADGVYEELLRRFAGGDALTIPTDINVFVLIAADTDEEAGADIRDPAETSALTRLESGSMEIRKVTPDFNDDVSFIIQNGRSSQGAVDIEFRGTMSNPDLVVRTVPAASQCVATTPLQ
jgi:hypothetical protein